MKPAPRTSETPTSARKSLHCSASNLTRIILAPSTRLRLRQEWKLITRVFSRNTTWRVFA
jgi:hypothetical protein